MQQPRSLRNRLATRVALVVFAGILLIEAVILYFSYARQESVLLNKLAREGDFIAALLSHSERQSLQNLMRGDGILLGHPQLMGIRVKTSDGARDYSIGEVPDSEASRPYSAQSSLSLRPDHRLDLVRSAKGDAIKTVWLRFDTTPIERELSGFVWRIAGLIAIISFFVTAVTVLGLRVLLLAPLTRLHKTLRMGPEPDLKSPIRPGDTTRGDELGDIFRAFEELRGQVVTRRSLEQSEARFRDFAASAADWYWEMDSELRFSYFSTRFSEITGVSPELLLGRTRRETGVPGVEPALWEAHLAALDAHKPFRDFLHSRQKGDNYTVWLSISGTPVFEQDGHS